LQAIGSSAGQPHDRAFAPLGSRLLLVADACGPDRPAAVMSQGQDGFPGKR